MELADTSQQKHILAALTPTADPLRPGPPLRIIEPLFHMFPRVPTTITHSATTRKVISVIGI